jgi:hypothetical protein
MAVRALKAQALFPRWTKRVATEVGGHDPLGLSRVAHALADMLIPGIVTNTNRARYYALYCWILWHIEQQSDATSVSDFRSEFQRREAAIAIATLLRDPDASPIGVRAVSRRLRQARDDGEVAVEFQVLPANPLGGFGQNYSGCLYQLGLTYRPDGAMDRVVPGVADTLVGAVQATVAATPYVSKGAFRPSHVSLKILEQSSDRLTIDAIRKPFARAERTALIDLFFAFTDSQPSEQALSRRRSLARILAIVDAYASVNVAVRRQYLDLQLLYGPAYFDSMIGPDGRKTLRVSVPSDFPRVVAFWRQFCLQQYLTQPLEDLLCAVLRALEHEVGGCSREQVVDALVGGGELAEQCGTMLRAACRTPRAILKQVGITTVPREQDCLAARRRYLFSHRLSEVSLAKPEDGAESLSASVARACIRLGMLYAKWRGISTDWSWREVAQMAAGDPCAPTILPRLDRWLAADTTWEAAIGDLVDVIVSQHDRVMYSKGRLDSRWLSVEDGRWVKEQDYAAYFRAPRHLQAVKILEDLDLLRGDNEHLKGITVQGRAVLKHVRALEP